MKEQNHDTLHDALLRLPEYAPKDQLWNLISEGLDAEERLSAHARALPQYDPPEKVWTALESRLEAAPAMKASYIRRYAMAAAASLALLLGAWWLLSKPAATETIAVTQQTLDERAVAANSESEDPAFQLIENLCNKPMAVCQNPAFKSLKSELDELSNAKKQLHEALGAYGDDPELTNQLVHIEQQRSALLRQMVAMI